MVSAPNPVVAGEATEALIAEIRRLRDERHAVILAHNYQIGPIQDLADFVGDSLGLARAAARTDAPVIVMCGVYFMAETAKILNPERTVLIPDTRAGCSLADSITVEQLRAWKKEHPGAVVVSYVNTTAEVKAESDICVTSGNAEAVIRSIPEDREILFLPDVFLGSYLERVTGRRMHIWMGECHVHAGIRPERIEAIRARYPDSDLLVHPECGCASRYLWEQSACSRPDAHTHVLSTEGMLRHARQSNRGTFIIATETGLLHRLRKEMPEKQFVAADEGAVCQFMKMITLPKLRDCLRDMAPEVIVPPEILERARTAVDRMLAVAP
ncbi:MAG: quinolinate synthase NadA [Chloroflexi bacterium]|jgi:quinolinate synthase|nr:quinolinate synthase NadA [Chloroflexota bacterium]HLG50892.1 quinolinate synthase NadA [Chloroflexota bacterium]